MRSKFPGIPGKIYLKKSEYLLHNVIVTQRYWDIAIITSSGGAKKIIIDTDWDVEYTRSILLRYQRMKEKHKDHPYYPVYEIGIDYLISELTKS